jgi:serine/threonine protein phosphatase PrpC
MVNDNQHIIDGYLLDRQSGFMEAHTAELNTHILDICLGMSPGKTRVIEDIEDSAVVKIDGKIVLGVVFDGSGESWWGDARQRLAVDLDGKKRTLGDIPGYLLSRELLSLESADDLQSTFTRACSSYHDVLRSAGLAPDKDREKFGGCTLAGFIIGKDEIVHGFSLGDAICIAKKTDGSLLMTSNQLCSLNKEHSGLLGQYQLESGPVEGMRRFVTEYKAHQRNHQANHDYGFFDGNAESVKFLERFSLPVQQLDTLVAVTDGVYNSLEDNPQIVAHEVFNELSGGIPRLLASQQRTGSPEASVIAVSRRSITKIRMP